MSYAWKRWYLIRKKILSLSNVSQARTDHMYFSVTDSKILSCRRIHPASPLTLAIAFSVLLSVLLLEYNVETESAMAATVVWGLFYLWIGVSLTLDWRILNNGS
ncbi:hypothetical protein BCR39DRAFT_237533 [Naematelia encephala]|uniref:Uncharacterized protein n=1 Tax=Naematelia encephala TaxID=71784 RepID=A0A1Y2AXI5_9TREE|nr:hypothetical protein BCR39DRAFT_237533 [Naematelia encephala]